MTKMISTLRRERLKIIGAILIALFSSIVAIASAHAYPNPLFDGADPDILVDGEKYWIFPTTEGKPKQEFYSYSSSDLEKWSRSGPILKANDVRWLNADGAPTHELWAPGIFKKDNKYFLFYAVGPQNPTPSRIGVATSESPGGIYHDSGKPLVTGSREFEAIDPMVFKDPNSDKIYLYCGGSAGPKLHAYELADDCLSIKKPLVVETPKNFTEGPFVHHRGNTYYLSYSHGRWNDDTYCVCYSTGKTPVGPWTYQGEILSSNEKHAGPGHHAIFKIPTSDDWRIVYHRWNLGRAGKMPPGRSIAIETLRYDESGRILPITLTDAASH